MYHNTTEATGNELKAYRRKAHTQDQKLLDWFTAYEQEATPSKLWGLVFNKAVPLTSVRRALTNLTNDGHLEKTDMQKSGIYGRPEGVWRLARGQREMFSG